MTYSEFCVAWAVVVAVLVAWTLWRAWRRG
jgi:hypothetical protein